MISQDTAYAIATCHREIEVAQKLLGEVEDGLQKRGVPDIRDAFGRSQRGLQLGVPSGDNGHRLYQVEWSLCVPVLTAHIGSLKGKLSALNEIARSELDGTVPT